VIREIFLEKKGEKWIGKIANLAHGEKTGDFRDSRSHAAMRLTREMWQWEGCSITKWSERIMENPHTIPVG
jgi:hypothetical protein